MQLQVHCTLEYNILGQHLIGDKQESNLILQDVLKETCLELQVSNNFFE